MLVDKCRLLFISETGIQLCLKVSGSDWLLLASFFTRPCLLVSRLILSPHL